MPKSTRSCASSPRMTNRAACGLRSISVALASVSQPPTPRNGENRPDGAQRAIPLQKAERCRCKRHLWWMSEESNLTGSPFMFNATYISLSFKHPATTPRTAGRNHPQNTDYTNTDKNHKIPSFHVELNLNSIFEFFGYRKG